MIERSIDLKDLFYKMFLKWRMFLVCALIGAIVFGIFGYKKNLTEVESAKKLLESQNVSSGATDQAIVECEQKLSVREIAEVKRAVDSYIDFAKQYENVQEYNRESIKMQLNPNAVSTVTIQYLIDNYYEAVYPVIEGKDTTQDIIDSYELKIRNRYVYEEISKALNQEIESKYVDELIETTREATGNLLTIRVIAMNYEDCQRIAEVLKATVENETVALKKVYGDFEIVLVDEQYCEAVDSNLIAEQQIQISNLNNIKSAIGNISNGFTDDQKEYYMILIEAYMVTEIEEWSGSSELEWEPNTADIPKVKLLNLKFIFVGIVAGIALAFVYILFKYLLTPCLRVEGDIEECYGIRELGSIGIQNEQKRIFGFVDKIILLLFKGREQKKDRRKSVNMSCTKIRIIYEQAGMKSLYLTGTCIDKETQEIINLIYEELKEKIEDIYYGTSIVDNAESLEKMTNYDGVVLIERIGHSRHEAVKEEIELCRQQQIKIIGSIILC